MSTETKALRRAMRQAVLRAGGHRYTLVRPAADENGQPTGAEEEKGHYLLAAYIRGSRLTRLSIDFPGILSGQSGAEKALFGLCLHGDAPREGDLMVCGQEKYTVLNAQKYGDAVQMSVRSA